MLRGIISIVYIVAGIVVANSHHYFANLHSLMGILSAVLAVVLWPLVLLGVDLHLGLILNVPREAAALLSGRLLAALRPL
jgi:hypothetical protein